MKIMNSFELFELYLKSAEKYGCLLSGGSQVEPSELQRAVPLLPYENVLDLCFRNVFVMFDTREEAKAFFDTVVGEDGPTKTNPYNGPANVYACWGGPEGIISENT
jgi:hypothetical protein